MRIFCIVALVSLSLLPSCIEPARPSPPGFQQHPQLLRPNVPRLRRLDNGHYRVRKPWKVHIDGRTYLVQKGYTSNGITAPSAIKSNLGDGVQHPETWAAVFHDWLFTQPGIDRTTADRLFYDLLRAYGVPETKARLMFTTVSAYSARKQRL